MPAGPTIQRAIIEVCTIDPTEFGISPFIAAYLTAVAVVPACPAVIDIIPDIRADTIAAELGGLIALEAAEFTLIPVWYQLNIGTDAVAAETSAANSAVPAVMGVCPGIHALPVAADEALGAFFRCRVR